MNAAEKRAANPSKASWSKLYRRYKDGAKARKILFNLNVEQFHLLCSQPCFYCQGGFAKFNVYLKIDGQPNSNAKRIKNKSTISLSTIFFNGIDRVDNNLGYVSGNVVTCCKQCNYLKSNFDKEVIINLADSLKKVDVEIARMKNILDSLESIC